MRKGCLACGGESTGRTILFEVTRTSASVAPLLVTGGTVFDSVWFPPSTVSTFDIVVHPATVLEGVADIIVVEETGKFRGSRN